MTSSEIRSRPSDRLLARFSRRTTAGRTFIPEIDGMRFVAIAMVVVVHVTSTIYVLGQSRGVSFTHAPQQDFLWNLSREGVYGVQLFFVISGFILALPFAKRLLDRDDRDTAPPVRLSAYYLRRISRLEPPYLIALTLTMFVAVWLGGESLRGLLPHYSAGFFYLHGAIYGTTNPVDLVTWSLEVEVQFYVVMPLLALVFAIPEAWLRRVVLVGASLVAITAQQLFITGPSWAAYSLFAYIQYFLMGFLLVDVYLTEWKQRGSAKRRGWDIVAVVVSMVWLWTGYGTGNEALRALIFPFLALALFGAAFQGPGFSRFLSNRWIFTFGGMCYSLYLTHTAAIAIARTLSTRGIISSNLGVDLLIQLLVVTPFVVVVGALFFVWVEHPFMNPRWPQDLSARLRRSA